MDKDNNLPSLWFFVGLTISSLFLIHLFGFLGIFVALAYPLWWFFIPQKTLCFFCLHKRITNPQGECPVCKRIVTTIYDPPLGSVFINMITIVFLSIASLMVIVVEIFLFTRGGFNPATLIYGKRAYFLIPEKNNFPLGKEFYFDINTSTISTPINVAQADIEFDKNLLEVRSIDISNSFATIFTQKDFSNKEGWIRIVGGLPNPGFLGDYGLFARVYFYPKTTGVGKITFLPTSKMFANDGHGTNILVKFPSSSILISREKPVLGAQTNFGFFGIIRAWLNSLLLK